MASVPALLAAYSASWDLFETVSLTPIERQVVYLTANFENECDYCVPWHSLLAERAGMSAADLDALRAGGSLADQRLQALHVFTKALIDERGKIAPPVLDAFVAAGFSPQQALEVVLGLAIKVMSNYTNSIAGTPLDAAVQSRAWRKPRVAMRASPPKGSAA